jgi:hypothetical protein
MNNTATTTYTFTPAAGECAVSTTMTVVVDDKLIVDSISVPNTYIYGQTIVLPSAPNIIGNPISQGWYLDGIPYNGFPLIVADNGKALVYRANNACGVATSNEIIITVNKAPQIITWNQNLMGCSSSEMPFTLTATASSGLPVSYAASNMDVAVLRGNTLIPANIGTTAITATQAGDENYLPATPVIKTFTDELDAISQHWSNVLFFDNTGGNYVKWQWYKNDSLVPGATLPYYRELSTLNGIFYALAINKNGDTVKTCPLALEGDTVAIAGATGGGMKIYPNPVAIGAKLTIVSGYSETALIGAKLIIRELSGGRIVQQIMDVQPTMEITVMPPWTSGVYIVTLLLRDGHTEAEKVMVK